MAQMICQLLETNNCSSIEYRRLNVMSVWVDQFPRLKFTGRSMTKFFDNLVYKARVYKPTAYLSRVYTQLYHESIIFNTYKQDWTMFTANLTDRTFMVLNSTKLRIDLQIIRISGYNYWGWVNFTFYLPATTSPSILTFSVNNSYSSYTDGFTIFIYFLK